MADLFSPLTVKGITFKNRIVMPPMASALATPEGGITPKHKEHYLARARAGVALIILEHAFIEPQGQASANQLGLDTDEVIPALAELAKALQGVGAKVVPQLNHAGSNTTAEVLGGSEPQGPSSVENPRSRTIPREMTLADIERVVDAYVQAARRVKAAGCDGVEIHGAHGYLLNQFLSPLTNRRQDDYGGSLEGRLRLPLRVIQAVRAEVGPDYLLLYRLGADDGLPGGFTISEAREVAPRLVEAGIDILDISGGMCGYRRDEKVPPAFFLPLASGIKEVVSVPVVCTGGIREPELANSIVAEGKADLIGIGRAQLTDPEWAIKAREWHKTVCRARH